MIILDYKKEFHNQIINTGVKALKHGKSVVFPTDTSYGLAVDATNIKAIKRLYKIKGRNFKKPVHVVVPSVAYAKKIVRWGSVASKLAKKFWPGALTLVCPLTLPSPSRGEGKGRGWKVLSSGTGYLGVRMPKNIIALDLVRALKHPITATSANRSGEPDCYDVDHIISQFKSSKYKPDIIINAGQLPKRKPSTVVKITPPLIPPFKKGGRRGGIEILRLGSIRISVKNP
ncbi:MAG: L-threonylcarbamoyladenylate synthase [Patescibacteria group bacterium]|mgnify:FL=1